MSNQTSENPVSKKVSDRLVTTVAVGILLLLFTPAFSQYIQVILSDAGIPKWQTSFFGNAFAGIGGLGAVAMVWALTGIYEQTVREGVSRNEQ